MRIAVVGTGALGGVWAAKLAAAEHDVTAVDTSSAVVAAINRDGVVVEDRSAGTVLVAPVLATRDPEEIGPVEVVFIFVKSHQTAAAAELARPLVDATTTVCTLQNGWGNADTLAEVFPDDQIVMGVTYQSATVLAPGRVAHTADRPTIVGPYSQDGSLARAEALAAAMNGAGLRATATSGVLTEVWKKLIVNCATLPTAALTRLRSAGLGEQGPLLEDVIDVVVTEAVATARARGLEIEREERIAYVHHLLATGSGGKASMLQDVEAQRKTEIDAVNGAVAREAERLGVPAPMNRALVALVHGLERSWVAE
jgi:2-dehydropantoate 2-reductase